MSDPPILPGRTPFFRHLPLHVGLGIFLLIGGLWGMLVVLWLAGERLRAAGFRPDLNTLLFSAFTCYFASLALTGWGIYQGKSLAAKAAFFLMIPQLPFLRTDAFSFNCFSAFYLYFSAGDNWNLNGGLQVHIYYALRKPQESFEIGINLAAIAIMILLHELWSRSED